MTSPVIGPSLLVICAKKYRNVDPGLKNNMCIREIPSRRIDCFFREGLRQSGADRQGGRTNPPPLAKVAKYGPWARVKLIHCCGHCIHFVISVNDMPPSNLNIKRIVRIKRRERREANPHPQTSVTTPMPSPLHYCGPYRICTRKIVGMSRIHRSGMWNGGQVACQASLQRTKFKHNNDIMKKYVVKNVVGTSHT